MLVGLGGGSTDLDQLILETEDVVLDETNTEGELGIGRGCSSMDETLWCAVDSFVDDEGMGNSSHQSGKNRDEDEDRADHDVRDEMRGGGRFSESLEK